MKARPILFSPPMIRALLDGRKTQTRRIVKPQPIMRDGDDCVIEYGKQRHSGPASYLIGHVLPQFGCPYGKPGDLLRVKEAAWMWCERRPNGATKSGRQKWHYLPMRAAPIYYVTDDAHRPTTSIVSPDTGNKWVWRHKVARFMPGWASRITLRITNVRVERLHGITEADAIAEGVERLTGDFDGCFSCESAVSGTTAVECYSRLWESINGAGSWDANPWVWVVSFEVIKQNVADVLKVAA